MTSKLFSIPKRLVSIWNRHPYTGNLDSETPGGSKNAFLHWGDVFDVLEEKGRGVNTQITLQGLLPATGAGVGVKTKHGIKAPRIQQGRGLPAAGMSVR